jgi:hypothetical protein
MLTVVDAKIITQRWITTLKLELRITSALVDGKAQQALVLLLFSKTL